MIMKLPYQEHKNVIIVECLDKYHDVSLKIPYHPSLGYWYESDEKHHLFFHIEKYKAVDLQEYVIAGNPHFQYKIIPYKEILKSFKPIQDYAQLAGIEQFILIVETLY